MTRLTVCMAVAALLVGCAGTETRPIGPGTVKITPLGSHDGELCAIDRALIFEDPDGTRILYDAGFTVRGADDPRLGKIDAVLLSHVHHDHLGLAHQPEANAGVCGKPEFSVRDAPNSNTANIAAGKKARVLVGSDMHTFLAAKVTAAGGDAKQVQLVRFGAQATVGKVSVATVPASHTNAVIATHVNEVATKGGKLVPGSKTEQFMKRVGIPTHIPLSGKTMAFDGNGMCTSGC